ncbi:hypothetical protein YC2023_078937 [Brassica napus]
MPSRCIAIKMHRRNPHFSLLRCIINSKELLRLTKPLIDFTTIKPWKINLRQSRSSWVRMYLIVTIVTVWFISHRTNALNFAAIQLTTCRSIRRILIRHYFESFDHLPRSIATLILLDLRCDRLLQCLKSICQRAFHLLRRKPSDNACDLVPAIDSDHTTRKNFRGYDGF